MPQIITAVQASADGTKAIASNGCATRSAFVTRTVCSSDGKLIQMKCFRNVGFSVVARRVLRIAGAVACGASMLTNARAADCAPAQQILFSCSTGAKSVSVCGSPELTTTTGSLQYRFGRPGAVELSYPLADAEWRTVVRGGTLMFSGGGGAFLAFTNAPYRYVVYSAVGKGWGRKSGVVVEKEGKRIASRTCQGSTVSQLGPDLFSKAGIEMVDDGFELP